MDLLDSLRTLLRRWPVALALLLVTLTSTVAALLLLPWQYESQATIVFLSSRQGAKPVGGNPWLAFDSSLTITAEVISRGMSDERTTNGLKGKGLNSQYTVGLAQDSRGPLMDIVTTDDSPEVAQKTLDALVALSQDRLVELQRKSGILPDATIRMTLVTSTETAQLVAQKKIRMLVVIFAGGMLLTVGVPLFIESVVQRRRRENERTLSPTAERPSKQSVLEATDPWRPLQSRAAEEPMTMPQPVVRPDGDVFLWSGENKVPKSGNGPGGEDSVVFDPPGRRR